MSDTNKPNRPTVAPRRHSPTFDQIRANSSKFLARAPGRPCLLFQSISKEFKGFQRISKQKIASRLVAYGRLQQATVGCLAGQPPQPPAILPPPVVTDGNLW